MKTPTLTRSGFRALPTLRAFICGVLAVSAARPCTAGDNTFIGSPVAGFSDFPAWSTPALWSAGVPDAGDDVIIPTHLNANGQTISAYGPRLDTHVTIKSLTMGDFTDVGGFRRNLFVTGTTSLTASSLGNNESEYRLGTLAQYDADTKTLNYGPNFVMNVTSPLPAGAILEFKDADIVTNKATLQFLGQNIRFRDQHTGINALLNFADNQGTLFFDDGFELNTVPNFRNTGEISLNFRRSLSGPNVPGNGLPPQLHIGGNFVNDGQVKLYANSVFTVAGALSGSGTIEIFGYPFVCDIGGNWTQTGGTVNLGDGRLDGFWLKAVAFNAQGGAMVMGSGTIKAHTTITTATLAPGSSPGTVNIEGNLVLGAGSTLAMECAGMAYDKIIQKPGVAPTTGTTLGGILTLSTIDDFDGEVLHTSTWEIITASAPITGSFSNIASGARLTTTSGKGSFRVTYGLATLSPDKVILSDYIAVNTPQTYVQWIAEQGVVAPDNEPTDDPNGDGITNLEAYFRGLPAKTTARNIGIAIELDNSSGGVQVSIRSPRTVTGVRLSATKTRDLIIPDPFTFRPALIGTTPTRNIYAEPLPPSPRYFLRFGMDLEAP